MKTATMHSTPASWMSSSASASASSAQTADSTRQEQVLRPSTVPRGSPFQMPSPTRPASSSTNAPTVSASQVAASPAARTWPATAGCE
eukprot:9494397-Pyramimonas_sp.AAC.1